MKQNAGNEEFVCGGGFEWNAGCGGAASSATPAVARQHRHFRRRPPPPCPRHQYPSTRSWSARASSTRIGQTQLHSPHTTAGYHRGRVIEQRAGGGIGRPSICNRGAGNAFRSELCILLLAPDNVDEEEKELGIRFEIFQTSISLISRAPWPSDHAL